MPQLFHDDLAREWEKLMPPTESLYELLQVDANASPQEIRRAFLRLAHEYHPDITASEESEIHFKRVRAAYEVLIEPQLRALYDVDPESIHQRLAGRRHPVVTEPCHRRSGPAAHASEFRPIWLKDSKSTSQRVFAFIFAAIAASVLFSALYFSDRLFTASHSPVVVATARHVDPVNEAPASVPPAMEHAESDVLRPMSDTNTTDSADEPKAGLASEKVENPINFNETPSIDSLTFDWHYMALDSVKASLPMFGNGGSSHSRLTDLGDGLPTYRNRDNGDTAIHEPGELYFGSTFSSSSTAAGSRFGTVPSLSVFQRIPDRPWNPSIPDWHVSPPGRFGRIPSQAEIMEQNAAVNSNATTSLLSPQTLEWHFSDDSAPVNRNLAPRTSFDHGIGRRYSGPPGTMNQPGQRASAFGYRSFGAPAHRGTILNAPPSTSGRRSFR